ncbi:S-adenosyl-L-methionine-dependent methyltransferase [Cladochytrium replicatum]|nr:S-adenosyl-L-methionine-dependent methyltransferase [Cladochytrium replicatum]
MSELGTKEYWDNIYARDGKNYEEFGDVGEIWFGEDSVEKMVDWVGRKQGSSRAQSYKTLMKNQMVDNVTEVDAPLIDLGCGNGHLLLELAKNGFTSLTGVDYSVPAVELARRIAVEDDSITVEIRGHFERYRYALDKGTFDAISLSEDGSTDVKLYAENVAKMLAPGGVLLITSCNFTESEVLEQLQSHFEYKGRVKYPTFTFGGVQGQTIVTLALGRRP